MKPFTREIRAGLIPEGLLEDKRVSPKAMTLFAVLTLYAEPDGEWNEWECDFSAAGPLPEQWQGLDSDKSASLSQLENSGYIKGLLEDENVVYFSFPDGVKEVIAVEFEEAIGTDPETPAEDASVDENGAGEQEVKRSAPAAYAEKTSRKVYECEKCSEEIPKGGKVYQRYAGGPRYCEKCVPVEEEESKAPITPDPASPSATPRQDPSLPGGEGRKEEAVAQVGEGESTCASSTFPIKNGYVVAGGPGEVKAIFREALEEYMTGAGGSLVEALNRISETLPATTVLSVREIEREREQKEKIAKILESIEAVPGSVELTSPFAEASGDENGRTDPVDQDMIETALGVEITRKLDEGGFLSGDALKIIDTASFTIGEFTAERGICFTRRKEMITEWFPASAGMTDGDGGEGRKEAAEGQG